MGEEGLPGDALRIGDPLLVGFGVAAGGRGLREDRALGLRQAIVALGKLGRVLGLDAEMLHAGGAAALGDCEIDARALEYPLGVVRLEDAGLGGEQRRIEARGLVGVRDGPMYRQR